MAVGVTAAAITSYENCREGGIGANKLKRPSIHQEGVYIFWEYRATCNKKSPTWTPNLLLVSA